MRTSPSAAAGAGGPPVDGDWIPAERVREAAAKEGIAPRLLRRLRAERLLAAPYGLGRGRGCGRQYFYPPRALDHLRTIGEGRRQRHGHSPAFLRHWLWWTPEGQLEDWGLWRRDRVVELRKEALRWDLPPTVDDEFSDEREWHRVDVATQLRHSRHPNRRRSRLCGQGDTEAYVRVFSSAVLRDDMLCSLAQLASPQAELEELEHVLAEPVDNAHEGSDGETVGELFERGVAWAHPPVAGRAPGVVPLALTGFLPRPVEAPARVEAMSEQRAAELRNAVIGWASLHGEAEMPRHDPRVASQWLLMWDTPALLDERFLQVPTAGEPVL